MEDNQEEIIEVQERLQEEEWKVIQELYEDAFKELVER